LLYARNLLAVDFHHARAVQLVRNYVAYRHQHRGGIFPDYAWLKLGIAVLPFEDVMGRPVMIARAKHFDSQTSAETFRCFYRGMVDSIIAHFLLKRRPELDDRNPLEQYAAWVGTAARKGLAEIPHQAGIQACLLIVTQFYTHLIHALNMKYCKYWDYNGRNHLPTGAEFIPYSI
ncbi:unnamed protein product, partial [Cladocopium goreaui]